MAQLNGKIKLLWTVRIITVKVSKLPKAIYRFNAISIKMLTEFSTELEQIILKFELNHKTHWIFQKALRKSNKGEDIKLPGFKLYYRVIVIKTACYWHKNRHTEELNRGPPNKPTHLWSISLCQRRQEYILGKG